MSSFLAHLRGIDGTFKLSAARINNADDACKLVQSSFEIGAPLEAKIYGGPIPLHARLSMYATPDDTIVFSRKDRLPIKFKYNPLSIALPQNMKFRIFTTMSYESLIYGEDIELNAACTNLDAHCAVVNYIKSRWNLQKFDTIIYLPGGILFQSGQFANFSEYIRDCPEYLYVVVTRPFPAGFNPLEQISDICSIAGPAHKYLLSPFIQSSDKGMIELACLMGYLWYGGEGSAEFISAITSFFPFDPLLAHLSFLSQRYTMQAHSLICISASLAIIFQKMAPNLPPLEASLDLSTYLISLHMKSALAVAIFEPPFCQIGFEDYFSKFTVGQPRIPMLEYRFRSTFQFFGQIPLPIAQSDIDLSKTAFRCLQPLKVLQLSMGIQNQICLFDNGSNICMSLGHSILKERKYSDQYTTIDPVKGGLKEISVERAVPYHQDAEALPREMIRQVVFICIDCSASMRTRIFDDITRLDFARQYFIAFANRSHAFRQCSRFGLISFANDVKVLKDPSELPLDFEKAADGLVAKGATAMYAAMLHAAKTLCEVERPKYPNAQMRIITLTDGDDNLSGSITAFALLNYCTTNGVLIDSFNTGSEIYPGLVALSHLSGGVSFYYEDISEGLKVLEKEEFIDLDKRVFALPKSGVSNDEFDDKSKNYNRLLNVGLEPRKITPCNNVFEIMTALSKDESTLNVCKPISPPVLHRIMNELALFNQANSQDIYVFPQTDNFLIWKAIISGPAGSPYDGRWYSLIVQFSENYPQHAPDISFVRPPFHVNISDSGRICLDSLDQSYSASMHVIDLLGTVRQLLLEPNFKSPIDSERFGFANKKDEARYRQKINEVNATASKANVQEWTNEWKIVFDKNAQKRVADVLIIPAHLQCQECQRLMRDPVKVSSGQTYCRTCVEAILRQRDRRCPVTGKTLGENEAVNPTDVNMANSINDFIQRTGYTGK